MKSKVEKHFDIVAAKYDYYKTKNAFYYKHLKQLLRELIPAQKKVLEIGCGTGDLIAGLKPQKGYGMDLSSKMISIAREKHGGSKITYSVVWPKEKYDFIFMSDVIEHLDNPEETFNKIASLMSAKSTFINTMANPIWEPVLLIAEKLGLKMPEGPHVRIGYNEVRKMMKKSGMRIIKHDYKLLVPIHIPLISSFFNTYLERLLKRFAFIEYLVAVKNK